MFCVRPKAGNVFTTTAQLVVAPFLANNPKF